MASGVNQSINKQLGVDGCHFARGGESLLVVAVLPLLLQHHNYLVEEWGADMSDSLVNLHLNPEHTLPS